MPILGALCLALFAGAVVGFMAWTNVPHDKRRRPDFMIPFVVVFIVSIGLYGGAYLGTVGELMPANLLKQYIREHGPYEVLATGSSQELHFVVVKDHRGRILACKLDAPLPAGTTLVKIERGMVSTEGLAIVPAFEAEKK